MKRYETMSKEEILEFVAGCDKRRCGDCPADKASNVLSAKCATAYLNEEVPEPLMVRRYQNICCKQDLTEAFEHVRQQCYNTGTDCSVCKYYDDNCCLTRWFIDYLGELEPEREKEWYLDEKYNKSRKIKA